MRPWLVAWLVIALTTTVALAVMLFFLVRQVILIGRTASRMQEELQPIGDEIAAGSARAADAAAGLSSRTADPRKRRR
jgi:hypothetical protein